MLGTCIQVSRLNFKLKPDSLSHTIIHASTDLVTWRMNMETGLPERYRIHMDDCNLAHNPDVAAECNLLLTQPKLLT
jgi:hypothetical protein